MEPPVIRTSAVRQKSKSRLPAIAGIVVLLGLIVAGGYFLSSQLGSNGIQVPGVSSPEQSAVRSYLKENLNDPNFEEVRWWPAADRYTAKELKEINDEIRQNNPRAIGNDLQNNYRVIRVKFRSKNAFGATAIADKVFEIDGGEVSPVDDHVAAILKRERFGGSN